MKNQLPIVAIVGRPNVGKSSLFNRLVGKRQAIVTDTPGTTRDPVQATITHHGQSFWLLDTAGLAATDDNLGADIQTQVDEAIENADVIVFTLASDAPIDDKDIQTAKQLLKTKKPVILSITKIDRTKRRLPEDCQRLGIKDIIGTSAIHGYGAEELQTAIVEKLPSPAPQATASDADLRLAIVGRPNVGKSSLFNRLKGERQAIVSEVSGTTRDINKTLMTRQDMTMELSDTGGIRRSGKIAKNRIEHFSFLRSAHTIAEADICILVIDAEEPATAIDQKIAGMVKEAGRGLILALNKWDLIREDESAVAMATQKIKFDFQFVWWAPLVYVSATSGHNVAKLTELSTVIAKERRREVKTSELNTLLEKIVRGHPPAGLKNRHPKLHYATQTDTEPPTFTFFGNQLSYLHWSYKRHLETKLRDQYDFTGTPIKLVFSNKQDAKSAQE